MREAAHLGGGCPLSAPVGPAPHPAKGVFHPFGYPEDIFGNKDGHNGLVQAYKQP